MVWAYFSSFKSHTIMLPANIHYNVLINRTDASCLFIVRRLLYEVSTDDCGDCPIIKGR